MTSRWYGKHAIFWICLVIWQLFQFSNYCMIVWPFKMPLTHGSGARIYFRGKGMFLGIDKVKWIAFCLESVHLNDGNFLLFVSCESELFLWKWTILTRGLWHVRYHNLTLLRHFLWKIKRLPFKYVLNLIFRFHIFYYGKYYSTVFWELIILGISRTTS